jgi:hypothetical protein
MTTDGTTTKYQVSRSALKTRSNIFECCGDFCALYLKVSRLSVATQIAQLTETARMQLRRQISPVGTTIGAAVLLRETKVSSSQLSSIGSRNKTLTGSEREECEVAREHSGNDGECEGCMEAQGYRGGTRARVR